jgi:hypothetical protein
MAGKMRARWQRPLSGGVIGVVEVGAWYNAWAGMGRLARADPNEQWHFSIIQKKSNGFELIWLKDRLPMLENFQIKYEI